MVGERYDVAVADAGINGCVAAKFLAEDGLDVVVLEQDQVEAATPRDPAGLA